MKESISKEKILRGLHFKERKESCLGMNFSSFVKEEIFPLPIEPADETGHDLDREDTGVVEAQKDATRHGEATGDHGHTPTQVMVPSETVFSYGKSIDTSLHFCKD